MTETSSTEIHCRAALLDIEGTVSPVTFVYDVMFPYIRQHVSDFLADNWSDESVQQCIPLIAADVGQQDFAAWLGDGPELSQQQTVIDAVHELMDRDAKVTGLKQLQGMIWRSGFENGELVAELFADVVPQLQSWKSIGIDLFIYSSGSIAAQKLFFAHTNEGDVLDLFSGHFDTTSGGKQESSSYASIVQQINLPAREIVFVSDVVAELDAARHAGLQTVLRPATVADENSGHQSIGEFGQLRLKNSED